MPKLKRGSGGVASRRKPKEGTKNANQAAARDVAAEERERHADNAALEAERLASAAVLLEHLAATDAMNTPTVIEPACEPSNGELASYKRMAIVYHYQQLGCPPESEWGNHGGTLRQLADAFDMPDPCDYRPIKEVLLRYLNGEDVWCSKGGQSRKPKIPHGQQLIAADCLRRGTGQEQAAHILTAWRETKGMTEKEAAALTRRPQLQRPHPCLPRSGSAHVWFSMGLGDKNGAKNRYNSVTHKFLPS